MNQVFEQLFDRLEKLGYQVSHTDSYSHTIVRDGQSFDIKLLAMENKGIMHVMIDRELRSIEFDIEELLKDDGSSKMNGLLARITKIFESSTFQSLLPQEKYSQFGIGQKDLDPIAAAPGMIPFGPGRPGGIGGGMIMDPSHPLFTQPPAFHPQSQGPLGFPPGSVPPGVRFDPVTPLGPRYPTGGPPGRRGFPSRPGPWSGEPDQDEFLPPGHPDDMYM